MTVLAVDPGPTQSAYVLWDGAKVLAFGIVPNQEVFAQFGSTTGPPRPGFLAIEMIASMGMAVGQDVFETCVFIGRLLEAWRCDPLALRIKRVEVKHHICHTHKAKDANIRQALIDRFGAPGKKSAPGPLFGITSHAWSALAVAVTAWDQRTIRGIL